MGSELLKMAEGFSMVAESLRSLAGQKEMVIHVQIEQTIQCRRSRQILQKQIPRKRK